MNTCTVIVAADAMFALIFVGFSYCGVSFGS
jgi:hypothetical protein